MNENEHTGSAGEVFTAFLALGVTSFGGPVAHLGYFRTAFVEKRRWLTDAAYSELVALCQFLPGPASSQVGIALGLGRAGILGALAAFVGFTLPSVLLLVAFAYGLNATGWLSAGVLAGLKLAALAVVAQAVLAMLPALAPDRPRRLIAAATAIALLAFPGGLQQLAAIALCGGIGAVALPVESRTTGFAAPGLSRRLGVVLLAVFFGLLFGLPALAALTGAAELDLVDRFYRAGSLVFGGGHVVLPLLSEAVVAPGLVAQGDFLAGYGATQAVPGPLFSFAAYLGFMIDGPVSGVWGAALALGAIYLPSFLLVLGVLPFWQTVSASPRARAALAGANAGVLGILAAALYAPVFTGAVTTPVHMALALAAFVTLTVLKAPPCLVVVLCGAAGLLL